MRWPTPAIGPALIALASSVLAIGCAGVSVWEVRPEAAARAVRHVVGQRPLGLPGSGDPGSADGQRPPGPDATLVRAQVCLDDARRREHISHGAALGLYAESMAFAWESMGRFDASGPERDRARSIYNRGLDRFLRVAGGHRFRPDASWCAELEGRGVRVTLGRDASLWDPDRFDELRFAGDYVVCGMEHHYGSDGIGVPMIAVRRPSREELDRREGPDRFYPFWEVYPVTAILRFDAVGSGPVLELHDTLRDTHIPLGSAPMPMAADLTTPTAYHFACGRLSSYERLSLFTPERLVREAGLHMLHPYERGKIPVVLIHGLGSSPMAWGRVVNELRGDPALRARYQFWSYMYPTGNPFMLSAAELRRSLTEARAELDPDGSDPAYDRMVLVGHSMGGLLSKLVISESGDALWRLNSPQPFDRLVASDAHRELLGRVFFFQPLPFVGRVVFIATPHRGSRLGSEFIGRLGDRLIRLPGPLEEAHKTLIAANPADFFTPDFRQGVPSSIDELTFENPYLLTIDRLPRAPGVRAHSVVGKVGHGALEGSSDGVVPYSSSHLDWVASEKVINRHHFLQDDPQTIEELRRILVQHLAESDVGP
jgi:pimeloyl-ACP methyl ester carboxylesterase